MIIALAGRRIDAMNAEEKRFPLEMKDVVYKRIRDFFYNNNVNILISSAACGSDLLAQKAAQELEIEQYIILPFKRERFRKTSVTDRPGNWGELFDEICEAVEAEGNLIVLEDQTDESEAYSAVTSELLNRAEVLQKKCRKEEIYAVIIWEGKAKDENDETAAFAEKARAKNIQTKKILITNQR